MPQSSTRLGRVAILWRGGEAERRSAKPGTSRFKAVFAALADVGVDAEPIVYEDDVLDAVRAQLVGLDGALVWVNPIHEGRYRAKLDALLCEVAARGIWVSAHPDVILRMGTKEALYRTRTMSWGCDTALCRTAEEMRTELPARLYTSNADPRFQRLRRLMKDEWTPQLTAMLGIPQRDLLMIWDADFMLGSKSANGTDNYVLGEINVRSVFPIPDEAPAAIARRVVDRWR